VLNVDPGLSVWTALALASMVALLFILARVRYLSIFKLAGRPADSAAADCMVIIPARDEEFSIGRAVNSLPHDSVIVVDDHSEDRTVEVARKAGAGVLQAPELAPGAVGKANACMAGARLLKSKWVLFTDADTWFEPGFLPAVVSAAEASGVAFLSIYLRPEWRTWKDALLFPYAQALFFCGVSPKSDPTSIFNGQCLLMRRDAYEFVGAHAAVMNTLTDDVKLAALARRHRLDFATVRAEGMGHVQFREPAQTIARGAFRFMAVSGTMGLTLVSAALLMALWLPVATWLYLDGEPYISAALVLWPVLLLLPWYRNPVLALAAPVAVYATLPALGAGLIAALTGGRVDWKRREV